MFTLEKNRVYGKTKKIDIDTLKDAFCDDRASFISTALLFGSRADGSYHDRSDYDFAFLMEKTGDETWGVKAKAYNIVYEMLGLDDCDVDIVDLDDMDKVVKESIRECYILLKGDADEVSRILD